MDRGLLPHVAKRGGERGGERERESSIKGSITATMITHKVSGREFLLHYHRIAA